MTQFKKGDKIKFVNASSMFRDYALTIGKVYEAIRDEDNECVKVFDDKGDDIGPYAWRFELVQVNGVDKNDEPKNFELADLQPLQRVVTKDGRKGIIGETPNHGKVIVYTHAGYDSFDYAQLNGEKHKSHPEINIVEVYANPGYAAMYNPEKKGDLIWKATDQVKVAARKAADEALAAAKLLVEQAEAKLAEAQAARAAL